MKNKGSNSMSSCRKNPCRSIISFISSFFWTQTHCEFQSPLKEKKSQIEMKLNNTQKEVLDGYVGKYGNYLETIRENKSINLGTKLLYLERAIDLHPGAFFVVLEKLYIANDKNEINLEMIRSLKFINDLYHNNVIKNGEFGITRIVDHFFKGCGDINFNILQPAVKQSILSEINSLKADAKEDVTIQKCQRNVAEWNIIGNGYLAILLDLPFQQQVPCLSLVYDQIEWSNKFYYIKKWTYALQEQGFFDRNFMIECDARLAHSMVRVLYALAWSAIPFNRKNIVNALGTGSAFLDSISSAISALTYYKLDNQFNFNVINSFHICRRLNAIINVMRILKHVGVPLSQDNFNKLITIHKNIDELESVLNRVRGSINQRCFDMLIELIDHIENIDNKLSKVKFSCETFLLILESVKNEVKCSIKYMI